MLDISAVLEKIKASPYKELTITSPHTGVLTLPEGLAPGTQVHGPMGTWKEKPGTLLATLDRERNEKHIHCPEKGEVVWLNTELQGSFVEAGVELVRYRHFLSKEEVLEQILKQALHLYLAANGFTVGDLGRLEQDFHLVAAFGALDRTLAARA